MYNRLRDLRDLNDLMEFEHVIRVQDGVATDRMPDGERIQMWAPECIHQGFGGHKGTPVTDIEPGTGWTLMDGYSGQYGYSGPIMHASEYIGGRMEQDILAQDGYYVSLVCDDMDCDEDCDPSGPDCSGGHEPAGWAVAYRPL